MAEKNELLKHVGQAYQDFLEVGSILYLKILRWHRERTIEDPILIETLGSKINDVHYY
jgi:hypothetical protein